MTANGNGKAAIIANVAQGAVIIALVTIMLKLFLIGNSATAANTVAIAVMGERQQNQYEMLRDDVAELKDMLKEPRND